MTRARVRRRMLAAARYDVRNRKLTGLPQWRRTTGDLCNHLWSGGRTPRPCVWIPS